MPISEPTRTLTIALIQGLQAALDAKSSISHTHAIALIEGLQAALDAKSPTSHTHAISIIQGLQAALDAKSPTSHTHAISIIQGLQAALDAKSALGHTHAIALIEGLQAVLDAKSSVSHTHNPDPWQVLSLASGWSVYSTGVPNPQYRKYLNFIEIKGTIVKSTTIAANETIATLPVNYRPAERRYFTTWGVNSYSRVQINADGTIQISTAGSNNAVGLDIIFGLG